MRAAAVVLVTVLAAPAAADDVTPVDLAATSWQVVSIGGEPLQDEPAPMLAFAPDGSVSGDTGCNRFKAISTGNRLLGELAATKRFCSDTAARDQRLLRALADARALQRPDADRLLISGPMPIELRRR